ncbi:MAG: hypothetical protein U0821_20790 [Chloroflexota bacterium]
MLKRFIRTATIGAVAVVILLAADAGHVRSFLVVLYGTGPFSANAESLKRYLDERVRV